jgi:hypothetical protein
VEILITKEKHGEFYYDASTDEALAKSALKILTERWEEGWYYEPEDVDDPPYTKEQIEKLTEEFGKEHELTQTAIKEYNRWVRDNRYEREYREWYEKAKALVESQDWKQTFTYGNQGQRSMPLSWKLLSDRSGGGVRVCRT